MISRTAKIHELLRRTLADGAEACSASVSFDEGAPTTLRLSRVEHDGLEALLRSGVRFAIDLRPIDPKQERSDSVSITDTSEGGSK